MTIFAVWGTLIAENTPSVKPVEVMAVYYPHWHVYPKGEEWFGKGWTEWAFVKTSKTRFSGQKIVKPLMGYLDGKDPSDVAVEIDLASNCGIDVFLWDWYWYGGECMMQESLEQGFLKAPNRDKMKFALMWCFHERLDQFRPECGKPRRRLTPLARTPEDFRAVVHLEGSGNAVTDFKDLTNLSEFTIALWANTATNAGSWTDYFEIAVPSTNTTGCGYVLERNDQHSASCYDVSSGSLPGVYSTGSVSLNLENAWHHLVMVGSKNANKLVIYVDGILRISSSAWSATAPFDYMTIGSRRNIAYRRIKADIDDVQVYGYALSAAEVTTLLHRPGRTLLDPPVGTLIAIH